MPTVQIIDVSLHELFPGALVLHNEEPHMICSVDWEFVTVTAINRKSNIQTVARVYGLEIGSERLLMLGFKKVSEGALDESLPENGGFIIYRLDPLEIFIEYLPEETRYYFMWWDHSSDKTPSKRQLFFIHEVQSVYMGLTGKVLIKS